MILLCGIPSETPLRLVADRLKEAGAEVAFFDQQEFADCDLDLNVIAGSVSGQFRIQDDVYPLERIRAVYSRLMDDRALPQLDAEAPSSAARLHCRGLHETLMQWMEITPATVINRPSGSASNTSKPYQAQLIRREGFLVPETLITNDPALVRDFVAQHGKVIYKSISAARSIVEVLKESDFERLPNIGWCPTQFQAFVEGTNLRVHVIGDEIHATAVATQATDYRYATQQSGGPAELREVELSEELAAMCRNLTRALGLVFSGIDLKVTPEDEVFCFEVNPCPAFSYYERNTGQPISASVARCLLRA